MLANCTGYKESVGVPLKVMHDEKCWWGQQQRKREKAIEGGRTNLLLQEAGQKNKKNAWGG